MSSIFPSPAKTNHPKDAKFQSHTDKIMLKNFSFLCPHISEFEKELQELLFEVDNLIEKKKADWEKELHSLEERLFLKITENSKLQSLIADREGELQKALDHLNIIESKLENKSCECEPSGLKSVCNSTAVYSSVLQNGCKRDSIIEPEKFDKYLTQIQKESELIKIEYENSKRLHEQTMKSLKLELIEEKEYSHKLKERCGELEKELEKNVVDCEALNRKWSMKYQSRIKELENVLDKHKDKAKIEAENSLSRTQLVNYKKINSSVQTKPYKSESLNSRKTIGRSDKLFTVHSDLAPHKSSSHSNNDKDNINQNNNNIAGGYCSNKYSDLEQRYLDLESKSNETSNMLMGKIGEINRLEDACQKATATIRRLMESKSKYEERTKYLEDFLFNMNIKVTKFQNQMIQFEERVLSVLSKPIGKVARLKSYVAKIADSNMMRISITLMKQNRDLIQERVHLLASLSNQSEFIQNLQQENLALSDVLTNAENFNRTTTPCYTSVLVNKSDGLLKKLPTQSMRSMTATTTASATTLVSNPNIHLPNSSNSTLLNCQNQSGIATDKQNETCFTDFDLTNPNDFQLTNNKIEPNQQLKIIPSSFTATTITPPPNATMDDVVSQSPIKVNKSKTYSKIERSITEDKSVFSIKQSENEQLTSNYLIGPALFQTNTIDNFVRPSLCQFGIKSMSPHHTGTMDYNEQCNKNNSQNVFTDLSVPVTISPKETATCGHSLTDPLIHQQIISEQPSISSTNSDSDFSIYNLTTNFLINEQKYSTLLERQIDAHLQNLKLQADNLLTC